ncbi:MAG: hypothetical protein JW870_15395 [Candidatus Delongbacteria bacterium]|nr:hypothetical protein [Candidatus Delongbacteria bacterium]
MRKLNKFFFAFILLFNTNNVLAQNETINAFLAKYKTNNQKLIEYSNYLSSLDNSKAVNVQKAIERFDEIFKESGIEVKDSALLIFIKFHRSIEYFTNLDNYADLIAENGQINESLLAKESKKVEAFGLKAKYVDGSIVTIQIPGYIESSYKSKISNKMQLFLAFETKLEYINDIWCVEQKNKEYIEEQGKSLILLEKYLNSSPKLLFEKLNQFYVDYFIAFVFENIDSDLCPEYVDYNVVDERNVQIYKNFILTNKYSKTARLLEIIMQQSNNGSIDLEELYYYLSHKECPDSDDYDCFETKFNYFNVEDNLKEIIRYLEDQKVIQETVNRVPPFGSGCT